MRPDLACGMTLVFLEGVLALPAAELGHRLLQSSAPAPPPYAPGTFDQDQPDAPPAAPPNAPPGGPIPMPPPSAPPPPSPSMPPPAAPPPPSPSPPPPDIIKAFADAPSPPISLTEGDPHLTFGHGGHADFRGCDGCYFNFLSARDLNVNVKTEAATFMLNGGIVHGTFLTEVHIAALDRFSEKWLNMSYWAREVGEGNWGWRVINGTCGTKTFLLGPKATRECETFKMRSDYSSAVVETPEWALNIAARNVWNQIDGPKHRLDLSMKPLRAERDLAAWPHGIIGQSYDGDGLAINGRKDNYTSMVVITEAMAEGAIEGKASDYQVSSAFDTRFKYSRFDATMSTSAPRSMARAQDASASVVPTGFASSTEIEDDMQS